MKFVVPRENYHPRGLVQSLSRGSFNYIWCYYQIGDPPVPSAAAKTIYISSQIKAEWMKRNHLIHISCIANAKNNAAIDKLKHFRPASDIPYPIYRNNNNNMCHNNKSKRMQIEWKVIAICYNHIWLEYIWPGLSIILIVIINHLSCPLLYAGPPRFDVLEKDAFNSMSNQSHQCFFFVFLVCVGKLCSIGGCSDTISIEHGVCVQRFHLHNECARTTGVSFHIFSGSRDIHENHANSLVTYIWIIPFRRYSLFFLLLPMSGVLI